MATDHDFDEALRKRVQVLDHDHLEHRRVVQFHSLGVHYLLETAWVLFYILDRVENLERFKVGDVEFEIERVLVELAPPLIAVEIGALDQAALDEDLGEVQFAMSEAVLVRMCHASRHLDGVLEQQPRQEFRDFG